MLTSAAARSQYGAMNLSDWLKANDLTPNALAQRVRCSPHTIAKAVRGEPVKPDVAREIVAATGHEVDVLGLLYPGEDLAVVVRFPTRPEEVDTDEVA